MATIDSKEIIDQMIKDNGETYVASGEPPVMRIVQYTNMEGRTSYGVVWHNEPVEADRYLHASAFVNDPKVIWERPDLLSTHRY